MALLSYGTTAIKTPFIIADRLSVNHSIPILLETSSLEHAVLIRSNRSCRKSERRLSQMAGTRSLQTMSIRYFTTIAPAAKSDGFRLVFRW